MDKDPLKGLSLPIPKPVPKPAPKLAAAVRSSIDIDLGKVVSECFTAIKDYHLHRLVEKAKNEGFQILNPQEKELFCYGIIKLGEALTFCRNERDNMLVKTGIVEYAKLYANARNHFIHHEFYHTHLSRFDVTQEYIKNLPRIENLEERLIKLKDCGLSKLSKPIRKGENNFPFEYAHFVVCLNLEFAAIKQILEIPDINKKLDSETALKAGLNNHIRNILAIIVDLTDEDLINQNLNTFCKDQKQKAKKINEDFFEKYPEFLTLFRNIKKFRNSLCHLDESLPKPYLDNEGLLVFVAKLNKIKELGYIGILQKEFIDAEKKEYEKPPEEKKESTKRSAESLKVDLPGTEQSKIIELSKKTKEEPKDKSSEKQEAHGQHKETSDALKYLPQHGEGESPPQTGAPGMRRK